MVERLKCCDLRGIVTEECYAFIVALGSAMRLPLNPATLYPHLHDL